MTLSHLQLHGLLNERTEAVEARAATYEGYTGSEVVNAHSGIVDLLGDIGTDFAHASHHIVRYIGHFHTVDHRLIVHFKLQGVAHGDFQVFSLRLDDVHIGDVESDKAAAHRESGNVAQGIVLED